MVDFILQREFFHNEVQMTGKTNKQSSDNIVMSAYEYAMNEQILFLGLSNGKLFYYKSKNIEQKSIFGKGKDPELVQIESPNAHKGEIRKIIYAKVNEDQLDVLITASADRTIKMWEPRNVKSNPCFQTIVGHEGAILDMVFISKVDQLITSSTDKTVRIWMIDKARQLLLYPWFVLYQKIQDFSSINLTVDVDVWINCLEINDTEKLGVYAGDSEGSLLKFKAPKEWRQKCEFEFEYKMKGIHKFGLIQILDVKKESCTFTIGYDQTIRGYGAKQDEFFSMTNPHKVLFTSICWDERDKVLYLADELGYVYMANVYMGEKQTISKHVCNCKIKVINIYSEGKQHRVLFCFTERGMKAFRIKMGQITQDIEGHTDSILKIICLDPKRLQDKTQEQIRDKPKIITCSLDNTIRLWDSKQMDVLNILESPEQSELSCMTFLANCCLVATGHEDGALRLWNLEISSSVVLKSPKGGNHVNSISCIIAEVFKEQEFLIAGSYDGTLSIWEISQKASGTGKDQNSVSTTIYPQFSHSIDNSKFIDFDFNESSEILCVYFLEDDKDGYVIVGGNSKKIQVYKLKTGEYFCTMIGHKDSVTCFSHDGLLLMSGSDDCNIIIWNTQEWYSPHHGSSKIKEITPHKILRGHHESIQDLCVLPNGIVLSCAYDKMVIAWSYHLNDEEIFMHQSEEVKQEFEDELEEQDREEKKDTLEDLEPEEEEVSKGLIKKYERNEQLRCMDYIDSTKSKTLYVGTNRGVILTIDIKDLLEMDNMNHLDESIMKKTGMSYDKFGATAGLKDSFGQGFDDMDLGMDGENMTELEKIQAQQKKILQR